VIKSAKIVKGWGLCKLVAESTNCELHEYALYQDQDLFEREVYCIPANYNQWFYEM